MINARKTARLSVAATKWRSRQELQEEKRRHLPILAANRRGAVRGPRAENSGGDGEEEDGGKEEKEGKRGNFLRVTNNRADSTDPRGAQSPR